MLRASRLLRRAAQHVASSAAGARSATGSGCLASLLRASPPCCVGAAASASGGAARSSARSAHSVAGAAQPIGEPPHGKRAVHAGDDTATSEPLLRLLECALPHVKALGWTEGALRAGAQAAGLSPASVGLLPRGPAQLVEHFSAVCDARFANELHNRRHELAALRTRERLALAVRMRLELMQPYISSWPQALGLQAHPFNAASALRQRAALVDEIWHAAGDKSSDLSWYSKRATLAAVYAATELFMITDVSPEFEDTWTFLERRISGIMEAGKVVNEVSQAAATVLSGVGRRFDSGMMRAPSPPDATASDERGSSSV